LRKRGWKSYGVKPGIAGEPGRFLMTSVVVCCGGRMITRIVILVSRSGLGSAAIGGLGDGRTNTGGKMICSGMGIRRALICGGSCIRR